MLTPYDKLKAGGNDIVQIVVTRGCDLFNCSNCTQLLPFRKDPQHMSLDCAEEALKSLEGWPGVIGMFGGNPCTHPQFAQLCELWERYVPVRQRGLWTNNLMDKGKIASKTFMDGVSRFNFNAHGNHDAARKILDWFPREVVYGVSKKSVHGAVLGSHADYGVGEFDWAEARERCDINQKWSAGIYAREVETQELIGGVNVWETPLDVPDPVFDRRIVQRPFVYFCEVAGAIDGVTGENNGMPATAGWWKKPIAEFVNQINRCCDKHCVVPLRHEGSLDLDFNYDVSRSLVELTTHKLGKASVTVHDQSQPILRELTDYQGLRR